MKVSEWQGCYRDQWRGIITDESHCHPAKMSRGLCTRIFQHCINQGYLKKNDHVLDCFGGVGTTGIVGATFGMRVTCVELEEKFVNLAEANFGLHRRAWETMGYPQPVIIQGDSRHLSDVLGQCDALVTSPPHGDTFNEKKQGARQPEREKNLGRPIAYGYSDGNIGNLKTGQLSTVLKEADCCVMSPPFSEINNQPASVKQKGGRQGVRSAYRALNSDAEDNYGSTPGQIGNMKAGDVSLVCTSPPYAESAVSSDGQRGIDSGNDIKTASIRKTKRQDSPDGYSSSPSNIGNMKGGDIQAVITSPPWEDQEPSHAQNDTPSRRRLDNNARPGAIDSTYGTTPGQIGKMRGGDVATVITSPPWEESLDNILPRSEDGKDNGAVATFNRTGKWPERRPKGMDYGTTEGQIGKMRAGDIDSIVTSPPWENNFAGGLQGGMKSPPPKGKGHGCSNEANIRKMEKDKQKIYGHSTGQIGNESSTSYWAACRDVYRECFKILKPGGVIVVVVKAFIKKGRRVPLPMQTLKLLIHLGFEPVERIKAMLVTETVTPGLFGEVKKVKSRKSFFRRLCESKGSPRIDFEEVLILRKP